MAVLVQPVIVGVNEKIIVNALGSWLKTKALQTLNQPLIVIVVLSNKD